MTSMTVSPSSSNKSIVLGSLHLDVEDWDVNNVSDFLCGNLKPSESTEEAENEKIQEISKMKENGISGIVLLDLSRESLERIGIFKEGRVLSILKVIKKLKVAAAGEEEGGTGE